MNEDRNGRRDETLGAALRDLDVPEHRSGFDEALRAMLRDEIPGARILGRRGRSIRTSPRRRWAWGLATATTITVAAVLAVAVGLPGGGPGAATAAEVRASVAQAWASADSISGVLVVDDTAAYGPGTRRWEFILTARGDLRLTDLTRGGTVVYDASRGVERALLPSESIGSSDVLFPSERTGLAPGLPDEGPSVGILDRNLGSVVRALTAGSGGSVSEITYQGRPAWILDTNIRANLLEPQLSPNHLEVTVDRETGFPLRVVATNDGRLVYETRVEDLEVNAPVAGDAFSLEFRPGDQVSRSDAGFRRVRLDEIEARLGYAPLVPASLPDGYSLSEVAVALSPSHTGADGASPPLADVVSLSYRRGLDQFIVTTRREDPTLRSDPLVTGEGYVDRPESVRFSGGALEGRTGELLIDPLAVPHVWAMTDRLVMTVSGDLTRSELLQIAGSLSSWDQ